MKNGNLTTKQATNNKSASKGYRGAEKGPSPMGKADMARKGGGGTSGKMGGKGKGC